MRQNKIQKSTIEEVRRSFANASDHHTNEVSKLQAIGLLLPDIRVMQNKGYLLSEIASMLSEKGIPVTTGTLGAYLGKVKSTVEHNRVPVGRNRRTTEATPQASQGPTKPKSVANDSLDRSRTRTGNAREAGSGEVATTATVSGKTSSVDGTEPSTRASREQVPNRYGFVPRKDTENI